MDMKIEVQCRICKKTFILDVNKERYNKWLNGELLIQNALPELTPGERELLISNTCEDCFNGLFMEFEI